MEGEENDYLDDTEGPSESEKEQYVVLTTIAGAVASWRQHMYLLASYYALKKQKAKRMNRKLARDEYIQTLTSGREAECISQLRMKTHTFHFLCHTLREKGLLKDTREVTVEEAVAEFMHTISHSVRNRTNSVRFSRSGETISRHFQAVLHAINQLAPEMLTQAGSQTLPGPYGFEGCVGALDGTHVPVHVPLQNHGAFRNRKGFLSQNVLGACGFDMNFHYVLPGWEGSATDARILHSALICTDPLIVPQAMSTDNDVAMPKDKDVSKSKGKQVKKYVTFDALMDEEMLDLMFEQVLLGRKADRGFKAEAYESVAAAMTEKSNGEYVLNGQSISNRCKHHKKNYSIATEMLNASGFGYDNTTKRIIASDEVWKAWLEGHPEAKPWKSKIIDYDKLTLIFGSDVATGQYARPATVAPSRQSSEGYTAGYNPFQADSNPGITSHLKNCQIHSSGGEASSMRKNPRKRNADFIEIISCIEKCNVGLNQAILDVADSIRMPRKQAADSIWKELRQIPELSGLDMQLAHEWLIIHQNMATVFLTVDDKRAWIVRQMPKIREERL